jgi:hypothetical protein
MSCSPPDRSRTLLLRKYGGGLEPHLIFLRSENTKLMLAFLKSTRIGFHSRINYARPDPLSTTNSPQSRSLHRSSLGIIPPLFVPIVHLGCPVLVCTIIFCLHGYCFVRTVVIFSFGILYFLLFFFSFLIFLRAI